MSFSKTELGTIAATLALNLTPLKEDAAAAKGILAEMAASIQAQTKMISDRMASDVAKANARAVESQKAAWKSAAKEVTSALLGVGIGITAALGEGVKTGADFEAMLNHVANNTSLTDAEIKTMRESVIALGRESGAPLDQLASGFQHIVNFGFSAADATNILQTAMRSAVSTGGDTGRTAELLANIMHEFGMKTGQAAAAMNVLHVAANDGNMTLEQLIESGGQAFAMAANLGAGFTMTAAAMSALTRHGFDAAEAATQVRNVFMHMSEPGHAVRKILDAVSKASGVDLVHAFQVSAIAGKGMGDTLDKIKEAARKAGLDATDLEMKLINAMRGGLGAMVLAGTGADDFKTELAKLDATFAGKLDPTTHQYQKTLGTLDQQVKIAKNNMILLADDIEKALAPIVGNLAKKVGEAAKAFSGLSDEEKTNVVKTAAWVGGISLAIGIAGKFVIAVARIKEALVSLGVIAQGTAGAIAASMSFALGTIAGVAAAFTGMRQITNDVKKLDEERFKASVDEQNPKSPQHLDYLKREIANKKILLRPGNYALTQPGVKDRIEGELKGYQAELSEVTRRKAAADKQAAQIQAKAKAAAASAAQAARGHHTVDEFMKKAGGGGGGKDAAEDAKQKAQEIVDATIKANDEIFKLSHSKFEYERKQARDQYSENIKIGMNQATAARLLSLSLRQISKDEHEEFLKNTKQKIEALAEQDAAMVNYYQTLLANQDAAQVKDKEVAAEHARAIAASIQASLSARAKDLESSISTALARGRADQDYENERIASLRRTGEIALGEYRQNLLKQMQLLKMSGQQQTSEYLRLREQVVEMDRQIIGEVFKASADMLPQVGQAVQQQQGPWLRVWRDMALNARDVLQTSLFDGMQKGFKNFFGEILDGFTKMLEQMLAQAVASGILSLLTGGSFGGGFLSAFGFDDAVNDASARRWGWDFATNFSRGVQQYKNQRLATPSPGGQAGTSVVVNMTGEHHYHNEMDAQKVADQIMWKAQTRLRVVTAR